MLQKTHELLMHSLSVISQIEFITPSVDMRLDLLEAMMSFLTPILENDIAEDVLQVGYDRVQVRLVKIMTVGCKADMSVETWNEADMSL